MVACRYGISLIVLNSTSHSWAIELNTRREIPYLRAPMYYSLFIFLLIFLFQLTYIIWITSLISMLKSPTGKAHPLYQNCFASSTSSSSLLPSSGISNLLVKITQIASYIQHTINNYITGDEWGKKKRPKYEWSAGKQI